MMVGGDREARKEGFRRKATSIGIKRQRIKSQLNRSLDG